MDPLRKWLSMLENFDFLESKNIDSHFSMTYDEKQENIV